MFSCNSIYPLPYDGTLSIHIDDEHEKVFRYMSYSVRLYMNSYSTNKLKNNIIKGDQDHNHPIDN